jgi:hypothetical protein
VREPDCVPVNEGVNEGVCEGVWSVKLTSSAEDLPNCVIQVTMYGLFDKEALSGSGQTALALPFDARVGCIAVEQVPLPSHTMIGGTGERPVRGSA